jgi:hypothetical protein
MCAGRGESQAFDPIPGFLERITIKIEVNVPVLIPGIKLSF